MNEENTAPVAYTIFCDDLRQEVGNKVSYMGAYQGMMFVRSFPVLLPKLCAAVTVRLPVTWRPRPIVFKLLMEESTLAERSVDTQSMPRDQAFDQDHDAIYVTAFFQITPFVSDAG